jgi:hypothetical protein
MRVVNPPVLIITLTMRVVKLPVLIITLTVRVVNLPELVITLTMRVVNPPELVITLTMRVVNPPVLIITLTMRVVEHAQLNLYFLIINFCIAINSSLSYMEIIYNPSFSFETSKSIIFFPPKLTLATF